MIDNRRNRQKQMAKFTVCTCALLVTIFCRGLSAEESNDQDDAAPAVPKPIYISPVPVGHVYLAEHFDDPEKFNQSWKVSEAKKEDTDEDIAKYDGNWSREEPLRPVDDGDSGLVLKSKARHAAIASRLSKPFEFVDKPLIVQYEVNFQDGQECGGAYLKLLTHDAAHSDLKKFHDKTPYTIMFGPDKCGNDHKLHFIFRHKNPLNGTMEEKHAKKPKERLEDYFKDKKPHLYTLIVRPDNSFVIKVDGKIVNYGSLLDDFTPPVNPPLEIEDPNDKRPEDWDDREKIPDPLAVKPEDWDEDAPAQIVDEDDSMPEGWLEDEPPTIPNPDSVKPEDWDVEMDGDWEPPEITNPKCEEAPGCGPYKQKLKKNPRYKGKWIPALINNPNYKGKWKPRLIHNPNYYNDEQPFRMLPISAVGFELWSMSPNILFDNIIITDDENVAKQWSDDTFEIRRQKMAEESSSIWGRMMRSMNYKPGWWALYFCYCAVPVALYVWYLVKRSREKWSFIRRIVDFTAENPWIWTVYILVVGLPILLLIYFCCLRSQDNVTEDKEPLSPNDLANEVADPTEDVKKSEEPAVVADDDENEIEEPEDDETNVETDEIIETEKNKPLASGDGTRRRKPNKE